MNLQPIEAVMIVFLWVAIMTVLVLAEKIVGQRDRCPYCGKKVHR